MTDTQNKNMSADEISIGDLIEKLWRKRGLIVFLPLLLAGLTAVGVLYNKSTHSIVGGIYTNGMVFPYAVANLLVLMGLAVAALIRWLRRLKNRPQFDLRLLATTLCLCLYGLAFDDILRWH